MYVVARDFGFAPNPFHGFCSLATCKPKIRSKADVGDWIIGIGGSRLNAAGRCVFAMRVTEKLKFNEYWLNPKYLDKKPVRNGSQKMMVGDNIYYHDPADDQWHQADSHHSYADGSANLDNLRRDTSTENVLISQHFFYFGIDAPQIPANILNAIGFKNGIGHRVYEDNVCVGLIDWLHNTFGDSLNTVKADPFDFDKSEARFSTANNKIS